MTRFFRRRAPTPEAEPPYWSKAEPPAPPAADAADAASDAASQPISSDTAQWPSRDAAAAEAPAVVEADRWRPAESAAEAGTERGEPEPVDAWSGRPADEEWRGPEESEPWRTAEDASRSSASERSDDAWDGEPAGAAEAQFASAAPIAAEPAPTSRSAVTDVEEQDADRDQLEMEQIPAEVSAPSATVAEEAEEEPAIAEEPAAEEAVVAEEDAPATAAAPTTVPLPVDGAPPTAALDGGPPEAPAVDVPEAREEESVALATETQARARHLELGLSDDDVLAMYRQMLVARAVDERMWLLQRAGRIAFVISGQGHEGAQVAIAWPLRRGHDWMAPYYRSVASVMTFGMTAEEIIAAHLAKADDPSSGGRQMPGHYGGAAYNIISTSSPVGTQALHATGIALGAWVRGDDVVAITYFGEGTANQGEVHEAMNFAGVHKLPVVFVCENNGYAISVPLDKQVGGGSVAIRAEGYGFPGVTVDGTDVLECYEVAREAIDRARRGEGPTLIEARVVRLTSHSSDDDQRRYRDPAEVTALAERDPIAIFGRELREIGLLTDEIEERMRAEIKQEINEANRAAEQRPDPDPETAERGVYGVGADGTDGTEGR